ncbi:MULTISPECIES: hypothetical protein [Aerococcus]|uniref:Lipoprotein n=1 Tax=Aerococcus mictus TaxID=2976810 RepID=A0A9Q4DE96_9LACT|nr:MULTISPECIES: hypothetical protein [Aerococcus]MCY3031440.1 hypothetical protein [Aerococcus sp. Group 1]MCY3039735.1 hypothetical protein [Aerococcus sp. Group 2]MCY3041543.1 hypothetical protein [Aerococcus sp. Group 2]MCY3043238.1 hypothetical protein [Aerococcus sp. Group 2]MCY3066317.1 hypothetical protein [Aerococcus mictus]
MKWKNYLSLALIAATLLGCSCSPSKESKETSSAPEQDSSQSMSHSQSPAKESADTSQDNSEQALAPSPKQVDSATASSEEKSDEGHASASNTDPLAAYDPLAIEYARIWLQLGPNQDADTINVHIIPQGTLINPYLANGARYPETVTQLTGNRLIDGVVTYSSNHDGTINLYNIPLRFDLPDFSAIPESTYIHETYKMAQAPQRIAVEPNQPDQVIETIQKLKR